jgi:hypothetical protein
MTAWQVHAAIQQCTFPGNPPTTATAKQTALYHNKCLQLGVGWYYAGAQAHQKMGV